MICLNLLDFQIEISDVDGRYAKVLDWIADDFKFFQDGKVSKKLLKVSIGEFLPTRKLLWLALPSVAVFGWGRKKSYFFKNQTKLSVDFSAQRTAKIFGSQECVYETLYFFILSTVGEWLEDEGWVRLHGLSFIRDREASVVIAPQGFGKSYLAEKIANETTDFTLMGDEIALWKNDVLMSFPIRLAHKANARNEAARVTFRNGKVHKQISNTQPNFVNDIKLDRVFFVNTARFSVFMGLGLPQMIQYRWRLNGILGLFKMAVNRLRFLIQTDIKKIKAQRLDIGSLRDILDS
jgi:hypothetical protein